MNKYIHMRMNIDLYISLQTFRWSVNTPASYRCWKFEIKKLVPGRQEVKFNTLCHKNFINDRVIQIFFLSLDYKSSLPCFKIVISSFIVKLNSLVKMSALSGRVVAGIIFQVFRFINSASFFFLSHHILMLQDLMGWLPLNGSWCDRYVIFKRQSGKNGLIWTCLTFVSFHPLNFEKLPFVLWLESQLVVLSFLFYFEVYWNTLFGFMKSVGSWRDFMR